MKTLRRLWYRFLRAPEVFIAARPRSMNPTLWEAGGEFDWFVYCDGEWHGPYSHPEAHDVANRLELATQFTAAAKVVIKDNIVVNKKGES